MIADACVIAQKTGLELRRCYVWMYKHDINRERVVRYAKSGSWARIAECIEKDCPLELLVAQDLNRFHPNVADKIIDGELT